jgi:hypothetical protein
MLSVGARCLLSANTLAMTSDLSAKTSAGVSGGDGGATFSTSTNNEQLRGLHEYLTDPLYEGVQRFLAKQRIAASTGFSGS